MGDVGGAENGIGDIGERHRKYIIVFCYSFMNPPKSAWSPYQIKHENIKINQKATSELASPTWATSKSASAKQARDTGLILEEYNLFVFLIYKTKNY